VVLDDQGIRTHGTGNLNSLASGASHGCHRLLGRNVVRLADFVLAHRLHVRRGDTPTYYHRVVRYGGSFPITIDSLGYRIELDPPIPVEVLDGRRGDSAVRNDEPARSSVSGSARDYPRTALASQRR